MGFFLALIILAIVVGSDLAVEHYTDKDLTQHGTNAVDRVLGTDLEGAYTSLVKDPLEGFIGNLFSKMFGGSSGGDSVDYDWFSGWFEYFEELFEGLYERFDVLFGWMGYITEQLFWIQVLIVIVIVLVVLVGVILWRSHKKTQWMIGKIYQRDNP